MNVYVAARPPDVMRGPTVTHPVRINRTSALRNGALRPMGVTRQAEPAAIGDLESRYEAALADLGALALKSHDVADMVRAAIAVLQALLDMDVVLVLRKQSDQDAFSLENGADASGWLVPGTVIPAPANAQVEDALASPKPVVVQQIARDLPFEPVPLCGEYEVSSGILAQISGEEGPWGILAAYSRSKRTFAGRDLHFVRAVSNTLAWGIAYSRAQRTLENLIEDSADAVARFDSELRIEYTNTALELATGHHTDDLMGRTFEDLKCMEVDLGGLEALVRAVFRGRRERQAEFCLASPYGERFYHVRLIPELTSDGAVRSVLVIAHDETEFRKVDEERASLQHELLERDRRHEELVQQLLAEQQRSNEHSNEQQADANHRSEIVKQLTGRETDILCLLANGLTNRQIARRLQLSPGTVRNHLGRVFPKLDAIDRTQAAVRAVELGLVVPQKA
jgi:PAS domain S-box-containing protein